MQFFQPTSENSKEFITILSALFANIWSASLKLLIPPPHDIGKNNFRAISLYQKKNFLSHFFFIYISIISSSTDLAIASKS